MSKNEYGAYLLDENGNVFYEDGMDVIAFKDKITFQLHNFRTTEYDLMISGAIPIIPFIKYHTNNLNNYSPYCEITKTINNNWALSFWGGGTEIVDVYIFAVNLIQQVPKYGMVLFNDNGMSVLTNETKRLNLDRSGEISSLRTNIVLDGSFAVFPQYSGTIIYSEKEPDNRSWESDFSYTALFNGSKTKIHGLAASEGPHFNIGGSHIKDAYSPSLYINTSIYD